MDERKSVYVVVDDEQMTRVRSAMEDVTSLVDSLRLGCEIAYQREPTQEEGDAHEHRHVGTSHGSGECFVPMGGHHGWKCKCGTWVWGGPTVCQRCVDADAVKIALEWKAEADRLREVLDALDGRAVIFDGLGARVGHLLDEMDEWIGRAGEAERTVDAARRRLACVADDMTEHAYQELASALESPPRIAGKTAGFDQPGREYTAGDALGLRRDR